MLVEFSGAVVDFGVLYVSSFPHLGRGNIKSLLFETAMNS